MENVDKILPINFYLPPPLCLPCPPLSLPCPAVSVVIPMYNAEKYIGECLESVLNQTFQSFEVIVVDDCSTDGSAAIVESYVPKFDGRLKLEKTETNSGGGGYIPRNIGLTFASGEYVIFLDADDFILLTALETLYNSAKEYNADVVYSSKYYNVVNPNDVYLYRDGLGRQMFKDDIEDKTALTVDNIDKIFKEFLASSEGNFRAPWSKFVQRNFLLQNKILFPNIVTGGDCIWCINVYAYAKRFLRLPTPLYFYRRYNGSSITRTTRTPHEQLSYWVSAFIAFLKALNDLQSRTKVLRENPNYCYEATRGGHFEWCLNRTYEARKELSNQEVYEVLYRELSKEKEAFETAVPFFFAVIDNEKKNREDKLQTIKNLRNEIKQFKKSMVMPLSREENKVISNNACITPLISIIIPLYNAEKYIGECLESIFNQTFQNFEVIVVDDCSTDSSYAVVESYIPKFDGKLKLLQMEKNSGAAPAPRNKGFLFSRGEYIFFMDSDDTFTRTALEEMYTLAKKYGADVVYCEKYFMSTGVGEEFIANIHLADSSIQSGGSVDKPEFISDDLSERLEELAQRRFWVTPWQRLVSRELLAENKITFPKIIGSDDVVWCLQVLCCAKKFLRVPNICYIRRMYDESFTKKKKAPNRFIHQWIDVVVRGLKFMDNFMSKLKFFQENPDYRYKALNTLVTPSLNITAPVCAELKSEEIYNIFLNEFSKDTSDNNVLVSFLFAVLYNERKAHNDCAKVIRKFARYFTARVDIKFIPKDGEGDFQILSASDGKVQITKPEWLNKDSIGYQIQSYAGKLKLVSKATADGKIRFALKGMDIKDPNDKSKRIPYWIDYTSFTVNNRAIFDTLTSVWHDKPYIHHMEVKNGEEVALQIEWLPHRSDFNTTKKLVDNQSPQKEDKLSKERAVIAEEKLKSAVEQQKKLKAEIENLLTKTAELKRENADYAQIVNNFASYLTARIDIQLIPKTDNGDFEILSVSDDRADVMKAKWLNKNSVGYMITSYTGKLKFIVKTSADGQIQLDLRGIFVRNPKDKTKRIPYWIDYTSFTVNNQTIFNKLTPAWHDKPYTYNMEAKDGEEITFVVEWFPHRSNT